MRGRHKRFFPRGLFQQADPSSFHLRPNVVRDADGFGIFKMKWKDHGVSNEEEFLTVRRNLETHLAGRVPECRDCQYPGHDLRLRIHEIELRLHPWQVSLRGPRRTAHRVTCCKLSADRRQVPLDEALPSCR